MRVALAQINTTVGDFAGNRDRIIEYSTRARAQGADLVVFPELSLCGYPPMDLLDHEAFVEQNLRSLRSLQERVPPQTAVVVGYVDRSTVTAGNGLQNVAAVIRNGTIIHRQAKRLLPTYDVFDESRYFEPAAESVPFSLDGLRIGIAICEDIWWEAEPETSGRYPVDPVRDLLDAGARLILAPSASPFHHAKQHTRVALMSSIGRNNGVPGVYVNAVGGNDSLIFDGRSFVTDAGGIPVARACGFEEDLLFVDINPDGPRSTVSESGSRGGADYRDTSRMEDVGAALVMGIRDYLRKTGFSHVHFGLSGGIDSAVVAVLAARAVGAERVRAFLMPSQYSSAGSVTDAEQLCRNLGIGFATLPIKSVYDAFADVLAGEFAGHDPNVAEENIQARIRGTLLMGYSNKFGSLLLTTGNKSELAVGYATLYGDMCGALAVIGDLFKTEVYELARHINASSEKGDVVPEAIITKAPSAELRPDQTDQDSLPPYHVLDEILHLYLLESLTFSRIVARGHDADTVERVLAMVGRSEYKRRQAPPVLKVSPRAFGTGRRMPIARRIYETNE